MIHEGEFFCVRFARGYAAVWFLLFCSASYFLFARYSIQIFAASSTIFTQGRFL